MRFGDLNIKPGQDEKVDALYRELQELSKLKLKGKTVLARLLTGQAMATMTVETSGEEVLRMVKEAEAVAEAFFARYGDDDS
jgi:hypothetical protein